MTPHADTAPRTAPTAPVAPASPALGSTIATPVGPFTVIVIPDPSGAPVVLASGWTDDIDALLPLIAPDLRPAEVETAERIDGVTDRVIAYHNGDVHAIDDVAVVQHSGEFLEHAWQVLREVPAGAPVTYTEFAERSGRPKAIRAAGSACSKNAAALFVPCHRVVPTGGGVGHFRWGPDVKRWLLSHEAAA